MRLAGTALALVIASARLAGAEPDPNVARADALFEEAQGLLKGGKLEEACAKFDESLKLNGQAIGTLLNVARCDARLGKLAHAVALYTEARDRGREQNLPAYIDAATEEIAKLTPLVPHLALAFAEPAPNLKIVVDDQTVTASAAADLALDPGAHSVTVTAPDRAPFETWVKLTKSEHKALAVPALGPALPPEGRSTQRTVGKVVTIGGGALLASGIAIGIVAKLHYDDAIKNQCNGGTQCSADGFASTESARSLGNVGTILGVAGVVAGAVGTVFWLRAPHARQEHGVALAPLVSPTEAGIVALGRF